MAAAPAAGPSPAAAPTPSGGTSATTAGPSQDQSRLDLGPALAASDPVGLDIPAIGVRANSLVALGLARDGSIEVPTDFAQPGWYSLGPTPGEFGPAVIAGQGLEVGQLAAAMVRRFAQNAATDDWQALRFSIAGTDQPILSGLRYILEAGLHAAIDADLQPGGKAASGHGPMRMRRVAHASHPVHAVF